MQTDGNHEAAQGTPSEGGAKVIPFPDRIGERRQDSCEIIRDEVTALPDARMEKVENAKERIRDRFYDRPEVLEAILRRLVRDLPRRT